jgi:hypothetical protein
MESNEGFTNEMREVEGWGVIQGESFAELDGLII